MSKSVNFNGQIFKSFSEFCRENTTIKRATAYRRYITNKPLDLVVNNKSLTMKESVDHLGKEYVSITDMAKAYEINDHTLRMRLKRGWSLERALTQTVQRRVNKWWSHIRTHLNL